MPPTKTHMTPNSSLLPITTSLSSSMLSSASALPALTLVPPEIVHARIPGANGRNMPYIFSNDQRRDAMSFPGHHLAKTPVIDSLVATSGCSTSQASILKELYTLRNRVIDNLMHEPPSRNLAKQMESKLYQMTRGSGGMKIPRNPPAGDFNRTRLRNRGGESAFNFPLPTVVDKPANINTN